MNQPEMIQAIEAGILDVSFKELYPQEPLKNCRERYIQILKEHQRLFQTSPVLLASSPGRTELGGNHTDHNHGKVLASTVHLDAIAVASVGLKPLVQIVSKGYPSLEIATDELSPKEEEKGQFEGIVRGILSGFSNRGFSIKGFSAVIESRIPAGAGLSSSAGIELLLATLCNSFFANNSLSAYELARMGQEAENQFFGKPCGLMDQLACAYGGVIKIDFQTVPPKVYSVPFFLPGYTLLLVDTGSSHADLTEDYASIPLEMKQVAILLGAKVLGDLPKDRFLALLPKIRQKVGDRALLRALHFFQENERVDQMEKALQNRDIARYLQLVRSSGISSWTLVQNCVPLTNPSSQQIPLALAWAEEVLNGRGAMRVHGGGFAGAIQV
ncbi:MAG: galactokinase family protein, partial [Spirochaetales bacterium]